MFGQNVQEKDLISDVANACRWTGLWSFIACFGPKLIFKLEKSRRWGLVCPCCRELRAAGKKVICPRASRRLREARKHIAEVRTELSASGRSLTCEECEGVPWVFECLSLALRKTAQEYGLKGKYFGSVPHLMSEADDAEMAGECAMQLRGLSPDDRGPLLQHHFSLLDDLDVTANTKGSITI
jgi:hypothetical protein